MKIILIGTSPAMLMEAILLKNEFKDAEIEIYENNKLPGGSWKTKNIFEKKLLETGSHIFAPWKTKNLYNQCLNIFKFKFKMKLFILKPQPQNIFNNNISKFELDKINYYYIKGGSGKLIEYLINVLKKKKVKIFYNTFINKVYISHLNKKIIQIKKKTFEVDKVYIPHYCKINLDHFKKDKNFSIKKSKHLLVKFSQDYKFKRKISYLQKINFTHLFDRLSNISAMLNSKDYIFCLRLSEKIKHKYEINKNLIIKLIKKELFHFLRPKIKKNYSSFKYKLVTYETCYRNKDQLKKLKIFSKKNKLNLVDTSELIKYMSKNIKRLKKL